MSRTLLCCAALAAFPPACRAEVTITAAETVIRLTVRPGAAPRPALRYLLLPELKEMSPGNPIPNYLKCFLAEDFSAERETLGRPALRQADRAARMDRPDWQILLKAKTDGVGLLLPDVQKLRGLAAALQERFRDEVAGRRFDDALRTAKTMFAMSRHLSEHPTLIGDLVGIAIAFVAIGPLEEMLEQPGCPNLYWALTNLPNPLVPLDRGLEGERLLILAELRGLDDSEPMSADQIKKLIAHLDKLVALGGQPSKPSHVRGWLGPRSKDDKLVSAARARLAEVGLPQERLLRFPADQVILLDEKREYEVRRDEQMKLMNLPAWQAEGLFGKARPAREPALFDFLLPGLDSIRRAQARLAQRVALLRHVEALRLYAAGHEGRLPPKLADVPVPLPPDPFTGKPFVYKADGDTAHLRGEGQGPGDNVRYEVTVRE